MKYYFLCFLFLPLLAHAQSDILVLKKHGQNIKTYAPGSALHMETIYGQWFDGFITEIKHDSVFLNGIPFHYKEISVISQPRTKLNFANDGTLLTIAGGGVLLLGAVNGLYRGDPAKEWYTTTSFITAGALLATGLILLKSRVKKYTLGKKFELQYFELNPNKNKAPSL